VVLTADNLEASNSFDAPLRSSGKGLGSSRRRAAAQRSRSQLAPTQSPEPNP